MCQKWLDNQCISYRGRMPRFYYQLNLRILNKSGTFFISQEEINKKIQDNVQILDETDCISHCTNTLGKGMNPIILPPALGK